MNTRLQVEHPVTELITGVDLVEQMIRVAAGEKLPFGQDDVQAERLGGREPHLRRRSIPQLPALHRPAHPLSSAGGGLKDGEITVRNDTGVFGRVGEISMFYDPMIAKLVTHAPTRLEAIEAQCDALDAFLIDGIQHNIPFLSSLHQHSRWRDGKLSTGFIREEYPDGFAVPHPDDATRKLMAAAAVAMELVRSDRLQRLPGRLRPAVDDLPRREWVVRVDDAYVPVKIVEGLADIPLELDIAVEDAAPVVLTSRWTPGETLWSGEIGDEAVTIQVRPDVAGYRVSLRGVGARVRVLSPRRAALDKLMPTKAPPDLSKFLLCPMPGLVVTLDVVEGQEVKAGETLAVVEAMKMQNVLRAERDVVVKAVKAKAGDSLGVDAVILEFA